MAQYTLILGLMITIFTPITACDNGTSNKVKISAGSHPFTSKSKHEVKKKVKVKDSSKSVKTINKAISEKGRADSGPRGNVQKGEKVYTIYCVACHQKDGKGMGGLLAANFVDDIKRLAKPDSVLLKSIREGVTGKSVMPAHKMILSEQEIKDVLAYIRATFTKK